MRNSKWALVTLARKLSEKFDEDWQRLPFDARSAWAKRVVAGIIAVVAALFVMIFLLKTNAIAGGHFAWEEKFLHDVEAGPVRFGTAVWLQTFGSDFMLVFLALTMAGIAIWNRRPLLAISIVLSLLTMDAFVRIGWFAYARVRPDLIAKGMASPGFHSFPSGHTAKTLALYGLLAAQWIGASRSTIEKLLAFLLTLFIVLAVPYGRLRMGVHWPTDIIGGYVIGLIWMGFLVAASKYDRRAE